MRAFEAQVEHMRRIFRGEERFGGGTPSAQATAFRFERMLPEILHRAREKSQLNGQLPQVDLLVSLSGFSPATTILTFELLRPRKLVVLSSEGTEQSIDVIDSYIVRTGKLPARSFSHRECDATDPYAIYKLVKEQVEPAGRSISPLSAIIDITGGKKVMSAAAALVAWRLDLRLCYIDSEYDAELRQPHPGTERLLILDNPTTMFGEDEMASALAAFRAGAYTTARDRFAALADSIPEPGRARFLRDLSGLYQAYTDFDLGNLTAHISRVNKALDDGTSRVDSATADSIRQQLAHLSDLAGSGDPMGRLPCFFVLGQHYQDLHRLEFAALLYYRTLEGCLSEHLRLRYDGFDCNAADYALLPLPEGSLVDRIGDVLESLGKRRPLSLPEKLGLLDAAVLLHALDDDLMRRIGINDKRGLSHLERLTEARNKSLLAHGDRRVTIDQCTSLAGQVRHVLRALWGLHRPDADIEAVCTSLRFRRDV